MENDRRYLIVTADDFGAAQWIDRGILDAIETGQISTVSALTNFPRAREAINDLHRRYPQIGIGIHLNITSGPPLAAPTGSSLPLNADGEFPGLEELLVRLPELDSDAVEAELRRQIEIVRDLGIVPDHLSSHHNVLAIVPDLQMLMIRLAQEYALPVRTPIAVSQTHSRRYGYAKTRQRATRSIIRMFGRRPWRTLVTLPAAYLRLRRSKRILRENGVRSPDHLIDSLYGIPTVRNIRHILFHLPAGTSELVVHLSDDRGDYAIPNGIERESAAFRPIERHLITNGTVRRVMEREGIVLARYADIPPTRERSDREDPVAP